MKMHEMRSIANASHLCNIRNATMEITRKLLIFGILCSLQSYTFCNSHKAITCGYPGRPANGKIHPSAVKVTYEIGDEVFITCNDGHKMKGQNSIKCADNGLWDKQLPFCVKNVAYKGKASLRSAKKKLNSNLAVDGNLSTCADTLYVRHQNIGLIKLDKEYKISSIHLTINSSIDKSINVSVEVNECEQPLALLPNTSTYDIHTFCANKTKFVRGSVVQIKSGEIPLKICEVEIFEAKKYECGDPSLQSNCEVTIVIYNSLNTKLTIAYYFPKEGYKITKGYSRRVCINGMWSGFPPTCELIVKDMANSDMGVDKNLNILKPDVEIKKTNENKICQQRTAYPPNGCPLDLKEGKRNYTIIYLGFFASTALSFIGICTCFLYAVYILRRRMNSRPTVQTVFSKHANPYSKFHNPHFVINEQKIKTEISKDENI